MALLDTSPPDRHNDIFALSRGKKGVVNAALCLYLTGIHIVSPVKATPVVDNGAGKLANKGTHNLNKQNSEGICDEYLVPRNVKIIRLPVLPVEVQVI